MPKFVVVEVADDPSTIDLLSFLVKRNFERVSLLQRLEDHPYLRGDGEVDDVVVGSDMPHIALTEEERIRLIKLLNGSDGLPPVTMVDQQRHQQQLAPQLASHLHQMPTTSAFTPTFISYDMKSDSLVPSSFDQSVNNVSHGVRMDDCGMQGMDAIKDLFPAGEQLRRKPARRPQEESCKATCKVCGHEVMYSPQRTWNLMRHVWIMHESSKPYQCSLCGFSHIKPYVRKHIEQQHKQQNASIIDLKSPELEAEWHSLLEQCFGVTYRKWKHIKDENAVVVSAEDAHQNSFRTDHFVSGDVMTNL